MSKEKKIKGTLQRDHGIIRKMELWRHSQQKTQNEVADMFGITQQNYSNLVTGKTKVSREFRDKFKDITGIDLFADTDNSVSTSNESDGIDIQELKRQNDELRKENELLRKESSIYKELTEKFQEKIFRILEQKVI